MSPEGISHAIDAYLASLEGQKRAAQFFYFGRFVEGIEEILKLDEPLRLKIDQGIWERAKGEALDPTEESSYPVIIGAILSSLEERICS